MTITTENSTVHYIGNGVTDIFSFNMKTYEESDIFAATDGLFSANILVILEEDQEVAPGGTVQFLDGPPAAQSDVFIGRVVPKTQEIDYQEYDPFPAESHERGLDKLTMLVQQQVNVFENSIRVPLSDPPSVNKLLPAAVDRAERFIYFDADGNVTVSVGTDVEQVVKGIAIAAESINMLYADNNTDSEFPIIGIRNINNESGMMQLTQQGDYPDFPNLPGGGIPIRVLSRTPFLLFAVFIDDGRLQPGTDSTEMLTAYRQSNPDDPFGFVDVVGVNTPNQALHLLQLDENGLIPANLLAFQGLRNLGIFRGDDLCDKAGDDPGECVVPDTRNPSQRFPSLDYPPGTDPDDITNRQFHAGDMFAITMADGELDGTMLLFTETGQVAPSIITVENNDGIIFIPQIEDPNSPGDILIHHGWYHLPGRFNLTTANLVSVDTAGWGFIGPLANDDVQQALNFLDAALGTFRADQVRFNTSGGTIIIDPSSEDVQAALLDLDAGALSKLIGGIVAGNITIQHGTSPTSIVRPLAAGGSPGFRIRDVAGQDRGMFYMVEADGRIIIRRQNAAGALETSVTLENNGNISVSGGAPTGVANLTRKDYVDAADTVIAGQAAAAQATADVAQSAAEAANANANTRLLRGGDTLTGHLNGVPPVAAANLTRKDYVDSRTQLPSSNIVNPRLSALGGNQGFTPGMSKSRLLANFQLRNANGKVMITVSIAGAHDSNGHIANFEMRRDGVTIFGTMWGHAAGAGWQKSCAMVLIDEPGDTAVHEYAIWGSTSGGTITMWGTVGVDSSFVLEEKLV